MSKIVPFNNIVLAELLEDNKKLDSGIVLPDREIGRFVKLRILAVGGLVTWLKKGNKVWANPVLEIIDQTNPKVGFINSKDIFGKIDPD